MHDINALPQAFIAVIGPVPHNGIIPWISCVINYVFNALPITSKTETITWFGEMAPVFEIGTENRIFVEALNGSARFVARTKARVVIERSTLYAETI